LEKYLRGIGKISCGGREICPIRGKFTAVQNKLEGAFKIGIRPQKHKRSDRIYF